MSARDAVRGMLAGLFGLLTLVGGAQASAEAKLPIHVSENHRYFEDASGKPFLMQGDTAWSLIVQLKRDDVDLYLKDRRKRGFNTLLVNLLEHQFSSNPPANAYGDKPFKDAAFGEINPVYFDHAAWVIERAQALGFVVLLVPAYLGANGGGQGWYLEIEAAGPERMRAYGEAVARRFARYTNIVWVLGGDFDAPDKRLVSSLAEGIAAVLPNALQTVHARRNTNTAAVWSDAKWLSIDTVYDYDDVHSSVLAQTKDSRMPVILIETLYENEHGTKAQLIRQNAYGALLAGAVGQFFGNSPIWHFSGPGVFDSDRDWRQELDSPGAQSMTVLRKLFAVLPWTDLQPDRSGQITKAQNLYAASFSGGTGAVIYGEGGSFSVRKAVVKAGVDVTWIDPSSGVGTQAATPQDDGQMLTFRTPAEKNAGGDGDWILLIGKPGQFGPDRKG